VAVCNVNGAVASEKEDELPEGEEDRDSPLRAACRALASVRGAGGTGGEAGAGGGGEGEGTLRRSRRTREEGAVDASAGAGAGEGCADGREEDRQHCRAMRHAPIDPHLRPRVRSLRACGRPRSARTRGREDGHGRL
jgi:hypothetical protein